MKIEILTRCTEKKPEVMTYLKSLEGFVSDGGIVFAQHVEAEITDNFILLTVYKPWLADDLVRILFNISPVPFSTAFYEIKADHRIIVTCRARPLKEVLSAVEVLEHLDLEGGELAGSLETQWLSRDVGIKAQYDIAIQGGLAIARIKMVTHFRESDYHCREAVSMVTLGAGLSAFSSEKGELNRPPRASSVRVKAAADVDGGEFASFINKSPGKISYLKEKGYRVDLAGSGNYLEVNSKKENSAGIILNIEEPWELDCDLLRSLGILSGIKEIEAGRVIEDLLISPDDLIKNLGFVKEIQFTVFSAKTADLEARYDIASKRMEIKVAFPWDELWESREAFKRIEHFTGRVMSYAV